MSTANILALSDIHFASSGEIARRNPEADAVERIWLRPLAAGFRSLWLGRLEWNNRLLSKFVDVEGAADLVVANGDFSCDSAFVGVSDDAAFDSAKQCLSRLRSRFRERFEATIGDHELGRKSAFGGSGGPRLESWFRSVNELKLRPFWQVDFGCYVLIGVTSSLLALEGFESQLLPEERPAWNDLREAHICQVRDAFNEIPRDKRILLFVHEPAALNWMAREQAVQRRLGQIEQTFIGHLHFRSVFWVMGHMAALRLPLGSDAMRRYSHVREWNLLWRSFNVRLCPALGCQLLPLRGLYYQIVVDLSGRDPAIFQLQRISLTD